MCINTQANEKYKYIEAVNEDAEDKQNEDEFDGDGRSRRKRTAPKR